MSEHNAVMSEQGKMSNEDTKNVSAVEVRETKKSSVSRFSSILMVLVGGFALFSDGYNAQVVGHMNPVLSAIYPGQYTDTVKTQMSNAFLIGEVFGMIFFGWAIDKLGRRSGILWATFFLVLGIVLATAAHGVTRSGMFWMMIIGRGVAGFGAGGEYPTCGTTATEASDETPGVRRRRGLLTSVATIFAIDFGFVFAGVVVLIVLAAYSYNLNEGLWRVCFGLGVVIPVALLFFRLRIVNSTQYHKHAMKNNIPYMLVLKRYWRPMLGTSLAWFVYDLVIYPFGIFGSTIIGTLNPNDSLVQTIGYGTVLNCFYLPGCILGGFLNDRIGRKQTMALGFILWSIIGFVIGGALEQVTSVFPLFVVLYGLSNGFGELGPGVGTFVCGAESFATPVRGHFLGFAAALGKAGAAIGVQVFSPIQKSFENERKGVQGVFLIGAAFAMSGAVITWFLIPDMGQELESEDVKFRRYLEEHGYDGTFGETTKDAGAVTSCSST